MSCPVFTPLQANTLPEINSDKTLDAKYGYTAKISRHSREGKKGGESLWCMWLVAIPPTLESIKDSGLYLEPLQDCWHYREVT